MPVKRSFSWLPLAARLPDFADDDFRRRIIWLPAAIAAAVLCAGLIAAAPDSDGPSQVVVRTEYERVRQIPAHIGAPTEIDIDTASQEELEALDGVGKTTALWIIANRPFGSWEELCELSRLRPDVLAKLVELVEPASEATTGRACVR